MEEDIEKMKEEIKNRYGIDDITINYLKNYKGYKELIKKIAKKRIRKEEENGNRGKNDKSRIQ